MKHLRILLACLSLHSAASWGAEPDPVAELVGDYLRAQQAHDFETAVSLIDEGELEEWKGIILENVRFAADRGTLDLLKPSFGEDLNSYEAFANTSSRDLYRRQAAAARIYLEPVTDSSSQYIGYIAETPDTGYAVARETWSYSGVMDVTHDVAVPIRLVDGNPRIAIGESGKSAARQQMRFMVDPEMMAKALERSYDYLETLEE